MPLSTFSFSLRIALFAGALLGTLLAVEHYCRTSIKFGTIEQYDIRSFTLSDPTNAAFGDSQIGRGRKIPGFTFFGTAGQQPSELLRLVHYLYAYKRPKRVILQMAPQWFGQYHVGRKEFVTRAALPPRYLKLVSLSPYFYQPMKDHLISSLGERVSNIIGSARAESLARPTPEEVNRLANQWVAAVAQQKATSDTFDWSVMPAEVRTRLTLSRVYEQNPRQGFQNEPAAQELEEALRYLLDRGAEVCLFRTPVTAEFIRLAPAIPTSNFAAFDDYASSLALRHGIRWIRFDKLPIDFTDDKFSNQDHLNEKGDAETWPQVARACFEAVSPSGFPR